MKILIGCETSGIVRNAFLKQGHDAWSCDILPSDDKTNRHIQDDVLNVLKSDNWDMLAVFHPPCTRLCNSGVRWLHKAPPNKTLSEMWDELDKGAELFSELLNADIEMIAVENPVMHKHAKQRIKNYRPFSQSIQPYQFASEDNSPDNVKKRTCLWLKNLPKLVETDNVKEETDKLPVSEKNRIWYMGSGKGKERSKFYKGIAKAMAEQWG